MFAMAGNFSLLCRWMVNFFHTPKNSYHSVWTILSLTGPKLCSLTSAGSAGSLRIVRTEHLQRTHICALHPFKSLQTFQYFYRVLLRKTFLSVLFCVPNIPTLYDGSATRGLDWNLLQFLWSDFPASWHRTSWVATNLFDAIYSLNLA